MSHFQIGCFGLILGSLLGLLLAVIFLLLLSAGAVSPLIAQPVSSPAEINLFLSEQMVSRLAAKTLEQPVLVDFEPGGRLALTMPVEIGGLKPVVQLGLTLESRGEAVVSQLHWLKIGFLKIPAGWLPPELADLGARLGQMIARQLPPGFTLVGLTTTADGLTFHLNYRR